VPKILNCGTRHHHATYGIDYRRRRHHLTPFSC
jgi:hypothetical protein